MHSSLVIVKQHMFVEFVILKNTTVGVKITMPLENTQACGLLFKLRSAARVQDSSCAVKISVAELCRCDCPMQMQLPKHHSKENKPQNYWKSWNFLGDFPAPTMAWSHLWWNLSFTAGSAEENPVLQPWLPSVSNSLAWGGDSLHSLYVLIKCFPLPPIPLQTYSNKKHV